MSDGSQVNTIVAIVAIATVPLSGWLFLDGHFNDKIEREMRKTQATIMARVERAEDRASNLSVYVMQLCALARKSHEGFSCEIPDGDNRRNYSYPYPKYQMQQPAPSNNNFPASYYTPYPTGGRF